MASLERIFISSRLRAGSLQPSAGLRAINLSATAFSSARWHRLWQLTTWLSARPLSAPPSVFIQVKSCWRSLAVSLFSGMRPSLGRMYSRM